FPSFPTRRSSDLREPFSLERLVEDLRDAHVTPPYRCLAPVRSRAGDNARGFAALRDTRARVSYPCLAPVRGSCDHGLSDEPQLRDLLELARLVGQLEERHQPCPFPRAEAVAQLLEVPCEEAGRIAIPFARLVGEAFRLGPGEPHRRDQGILE